MARIVMDRAVPDAVGWIDSPPRCVFRLDDEVCEGEGAAESDGTGKTRRKKKSWRLRRPEAVHDEVLARLLALNQQRAEEERKMAAPKEKAKPVKNVAAKKASKAGGSARQPSRHAASSHAALALFGDDQ